MGGGVNKRGRGLHIYICVYIYIYICTYFYCIVPNRVVLCYVVLSCMVLRMVL